LVKCVLHNMVSYWIYSFELPSSMVKEPERAFSNFVWNHRMHAWAWKDMCRPKDGGGVDIRKLNDVNLASGVRLVWRLCTSDSLWAQWMKAHYLKGKHINQSAANVLDSGSWIWSVT